MSNEINHSKEKDTVSASVDENSVNIVRSHGRSSVSHKHANNKEGIKRKTSILPDLLRSVTLEEIIQAVDIVTEEEENINEEQNVSNIGVLDETKGPVFLQGLSSYVD